HLPDQSVERTLTLPGLAGGAEHHLECRRCVADPGGQDRLAQGIDCLAELPGRFGEPKVGTPRSARAGLFQELRSAVGRVCKHFGYTFRPRPDDRQFVSLEHTGSWLCWL